jgi:hypothetical protein
VLPRSPAASTLAYNCKLCAHAARWSSRIMDAERINTVEYALDDLGRRADELRRYL